LVDRAFVHVLWCVRIARRPKPPRPKRRKERIDIVCCDYDHGAEDSITAMTGQKQVVAIASENAKRGIVKFVVAIYAFEIKDARVERE
jgi:hypothetical protein